jgi:hypothetical protein
LYGWSKKLKKKNQKLFRPRYSLYYLEDLSARGKRSEKTYAGTCTEKSRIEIHQRNGKLIQQSSRNLQRREKKKRAENCGKQNLS